MKGLHLKNSALLYGGAIVALTCVAYVGTSIITKVRVEDKLATANGAMNVVKHCLPEEANDEVALNAAAARQCIADGFADFLKDDLSNI